VQRGARDRGARHQSRRQVRHGRNGAGAAHLQLNIQNARRLLLGGELLTLPLLLKINQSFTHIPFSGIKGTVADATRNPGEFIFLNLTFDFSLIVNLHF